ncbi:MAG: serine/threonine-protein phosphatase, partial [Erysipelotrichia bacterium]|nr:serine/threonine-protein phosphatase [Erysipelotrichia bacterium]
NFRMRLPGAIVSEFSAVMGSLGRTMENFRELQVARTVQETLWPEEPLGGHDWDLCGKSLTATELGGDHYDWMHLKDGRVLVVVGDVTGHGIAPAMVQASIKVWLALNAEKCSNAVDLLREIGRLHFDYGIRRLYMTCWLAYYTPETGMLEYASAGHPYPIIVSSDGSAEMLKLPGMPLGSKLDLKIYGDTRFLLPGSSLVLYTDGIIEITDNARQMLGFDGFLELCRRIHCMSPSAAIDHILTAASAWGERNDDQTVIVLKRYAIGDKNANG